MEKIEFARFLRKNQTDVEKLMWNLLKSRRFAGYKFRRQRPIGKYIVDFVCLEKRLIIECDGGGHGEGDKARDLWLNAQGYLVLRFWNNEFIENSEGVMMLILDVLSNPHSHSLPNWERDSTALNPSPNLGEGKDEGLS